MRCPKCKQRVLQKSGSETRMRTRGAVVFSEDGLCKAQCYWCREPIELPLEIKVDTKIPAERFIIPPSTKGA